MKKNIIKSDDYKIFIKEIKNRIQSSQIKAAISVNQEMLKLYWFIGSEIVKKQETANWGDGLLIQISSDLKKEFPDMKGFSHRNLKYIRQWFNFWNNNLEIRPQPVDELFTTKNEIGKQLVAQLNNNEPHLIFQIPWGHNILIVSKANSTKEAIFYVNKTIKNNWSRNVLLNQIESKLYERQGKAITNFDQHLPTNNSDLAKEVLKDPYNFDFLTMHEKYNERELEKALVADITNFLLELGEGFSYVGKQYKLTVDNEDFYIDLLFYHIKLHSYVVIELKTGKFKPEYAGKLNFYISAVDGILKTENDNPTIGILICKEKSKTIVEYALKDISKPIGVSEYELTKHLPDEYKDALPSIEQIEKEIGDALSLSKGGGDE